MEITSILERLQAVKKSGDGWQARCPAHDDKKPSLTISEGADGKLLLHCHRGCTPDAVCSALGLKLADLFTSNGSPSQIVATYPYHDEAGKVLSEVVRFFPKDFRQRKPDSTALGGWTWNVKGVQKVLFRLPEILKAKASGKFIFVTEGEKDALAMVQHKFAATCNPGGAGKWADSYTETLRGADVVILPDKDAAGRAHAQLVAGKLHGVAKSVRVLELPDVDGTPVKDVADFFAAGGDAGQIGELVDRTPEWTLAKIEKAEIVASQDETEFEFANRLADTLPPIKTCGSTWHAYEQGAWHKTERAIFRPRAQAILPEFIRTARREATLLDHLEGRCQFNEFDFAGFYKFGPGGEILVNVVNGVLSIQPGKTKLLDHSPDYLFTLRVAAMFNPETDAPIFRRILGELLPDADDQKLLQLFSGYLLLPDCRFEAALVSYGEAGRGKSTVAEAIANALGPDLVVRLTMSQICDPKSYHVPKLRHAAVNLGTELDAVELDESGSFKAIVSGEPIEARPIFGSPFTMRPACKLMFLANSLPRFRHGTDAELRRARFLRFDVLPVEKDVTLKIKLAGERDGVFAWMVEGLAELLTLAEMPIGGRASRAVLDRFRISNDPCGSFVTLRCQLSPDATVAKDDLRAAFGDFCERHELPKSCGDWFLKSLYERWPQLRETRPCADNGDRYRAVAGIKLRK